MIPVLHGVWAAAGGLVGDFEHIETQTVGAGGSASVTFSSIAGTYKHLQIRGIARTTRSDYPDDYLGIRLNSDTGSNYAYHNLNGDGGTAASQNGVSQTFMYVQRVASSTSGSNIFGAIVADILDYASTSKNKTVRTLGGIDRNGGGMVALNSGLWMSTNAVTSVTIIGQGGSSNLAQYSSFSLYGIR